MMDAYIIRNKKHFAVGALYASLHELLERICIKCFFGEYGTNVARFVIDEITWTFAP